MHTTGKVILLNGCSSAGKSTLAAKLQQLLPEPYQHISLDQFRDGLPIRYRGLNSPKDAPGAAGINVIPVADDARLLTRIEFGEHGEQMLKGMRRSIAQFSAQGLGVIVDDLLFKPEYLQDYAQVLNTQCSWLVGVHCAAEVVEQREAARIGRFPGTAIEHMQRVHAHGVDYDVEVDTSLLSPKQAALTVIEALNHAPAALQQAAKHA